MIHAKLLIQDRDFTPDEHGKYQRTYFGVRFVHNESGYRCIQLQPGTGTHQLLVRNQLIDDYPPQRLPPNAEQAAVLIEFYEPPTWVRGDVSLLRLVNSGSTALRCIQEPLPRHQFLVYRLETVDTSARDVFLIGITRDLFNRLNQGATHDREQTTFKPSPGDTSARRREKGHVYFPRPRSRAQRRQ